MSIIQKQTDILNELVLLAAERDHLSVFPQEIREVMHNHDISFEDASLSFLNAAFCPVVVRYTEEKVWEIPLKEIKDALNETPTKGDRASGFFRLHPDIKPKFDKGLRFTPVVESDRTFMQRMWLKTSTFLNKLKFPDILKRKPWLITGLSFVISFLGYSALLGPKVTLGLMSLLMAHEMGHWWVAQRTKLAANPPLFIPFMGAVISMKEEPRNAWEEANLGIMGPLTGTIATLGVAIVGNYMGGSFWHLAVLMGLWLNLFNLLPMLPLDGGRVLSLLGTKASLTFFILGAVVVLYFANLASAGFLILLGGTEVAYRIKKNRPKRKTPSLKVAAMLGIYLSLALGLGYALQNIYYDTTLSNIEEITFLGVIGGPMLIEWAQRKMTWNTKTSCTTATTVDQPLFHLTVG